jgi:TonB family protein
VFGCLVLLLLLLSGGDEKQSPPSPEPGVFRVGPGVTPPKIRHKEEPDYTRAASDAKVQGQCLLELIVDEHGMPTKIAVLSPLGFGLDEQAIDAISKWRFVPGQKDGIPVKIQATVEVNFRLLGQHYDENAEHRRTEFNEFLARLKQQQGGKPTPQQVELIQKLVGEKFAPADYVLGVWKLSGKDMEKNVAEGLDLLKKAMDKHYGPALFYWGRLKMAGQFMPKDEAAGMKLIRDAASLGSVDAQMLLGRKYESGQGVEKDLARSRHYFRLCAASAVPECQYRLARLLLSEPDRSERSFLQAVAWLQLASDHGFAEAKAMADSEAGALTEDQKSWVSRLKKQLERRPI